MGLLTGSEGVMTQVRTGYLAAARAAAELVADPAVTTAWQQPGALPRMSVGAPASHLSGQITFVARVLGDPPATEPTIPILDYYARVGWIGTGLDEPFNLRIQRGEEKAAADGPAPMIERTRQALAEVEAGLPDAPGRPIHLPVWGDWSISLDDFVTSRLMELIVHSDDLTVSVGLPTPEFPPEATDTVVTLLARLAVQRHGPLPVLRTLSGSERAPGDIAAI
ncbi:MAG TPA: maleylpyruvate isomerase N-terminal domain-containing protein [Streptosporangiaceae bacterium]|nr:maleylpyruvate isomerase N-terminal domain-containing protein [Streptosporangiaceae bacterium]